MNRRIIDKYEFSSDGDLPPDDVLMLMLRRQWSGESDGEGIIPESVFDDESEKGSAFKMEYDRLRQEISKAHPYITCIYEGLPPDCDESEFPSDQDNEQMCAHFFSTDAYRRALEPKAVELAKKYGYM